MEILVDSNIPHGIDLFSPYGAVKTFAGRHLKNQEVKNASALIIRSVTEIDKHLLDNSKVKFVGSCTIGTDHVDTDYLHSRNIQFAYAPGCNCNAVGDYVISALYSLQQYQGYNLKDKTLGIIGFGNVGRNLSKKALSIGLKVLMNDPPLFENGLQRENLSNLSHVLDQADILSFHVPLKASGPHKTLKMFNSHFLDAIKKPVVIINSSRGNVIDEKVIISGKKSGSVKHLILDVFPDEPVISTDLLSACDIITPHIAGYSVEGKMKGSLDILTAFTGYFNFPSRQYEQWMTPPEQSIEWHSQGDDMFLHKLCENIFPIRDLCKNLQSAVKSQDPSAAFDRLRKKLANRQDFTSFRITGVPVEKFQLIEKLKGLGFRLEVFAQTEAMT